MNLQYQNLSWDSIKDIQSCISDTIQRSVIEAVLNSQFYGILLDKSRDMSVQKHLSICIRYVLNRQSRKENPQKLTQLSSISHPRHLVGKRTAQKDTIIDITSDSQVNSNFPYRWSPASLTFNNYFYLFLYLYIT